MSRNHSVIKTDFFTTVQMPLLQPMCLITTHSWARSLTNNSLPEWNMSCGKLLQCHESSLALQLSNKIFILDERNLLADFITKAEQLSRNIFTCHSDPEAVCLFCGPPSPTISPPLTTKLRAVYLLPSSELLCLGFHDQKGMSWVTCPRSVVSLVTLFGDTSNHHHHCLLLWCKGNGYCLTGPVHSHWNNFLACTLPSRTSVHVLQTFSMLFQQPHVHN